MEALWVGYLWLKATTCRFSMLSKNGSLVNFITLHGDYLVAEWHKVSGVSIVFTAGPVLHICAWTLLHMVHWRGARVMCCILSWISHQHTSKCQYTSGADLLTYFGIPIRKSPKRQSDKAICYAYLVTPFLLNIELRGSTRGLQPWIL